MAKAKNVTVESVVEQLLERKAVDVVALDVKDLCSFTDHFVIASGGSKRQVQAMSDYLIDNIGKAHLVEGAETGEWILMDYHDVVVHLFHAPVRALFDLEGLWHKAPKREFKDLVENKQAS